MSAELAGKDGFVLILASIFVLSLTSPFFTKLEAYFTAFVLEHPISAALFMACVAAGKVVAQPLWVLLTGMRSLAAVFRLAALAWGVSAGLFFLMGHLEPWGTMLSAFLFGGASGGVFMALWSLLARSAAINASDTTRRFGLFTFFSKTAQAISILVIGQMLSLFDYQAIGGQPFLMALMSGIPAVGALILGGVVIPYCCQIVGEIDLGRTIAMPELAVKDPRDHRAALPSYMGSGMMRDCLGMRQIVFLTYGQHISKDCRRPIWPPC